MAAVTAVLASGILVGVARSARTLRARSNTADGVVGLLVARAGNVVASSNTANIIRTAFGGAGGLGTQAGGGGGRALGGRLGSSQDQERGDGDDVELHFDCD